MKAHKYWSIGAIVTMVGTFYTGYKGLKAAHKYFAFGSLICMIMAVYSGHKMICGNKRTRKQMEVKEKMRTKIIWLSMRNQLFMLIYGILLLHHYIE